MGNKGKEAIRPQSWPRVKSRNLSHWKEVGSSWVSQTVFGVLGSSVKKMLAVTAQEKQ